MRLRHSVILVVFVSSVAVLILYMLLIQANNQNRASCERVNDLRAQFNDRSIPLREYADILIDARSGPDSIRTAVANGAAINTREVRQLRRVRRKIGTVPLTECDEEFPRPFPL